MNNIASIAETFLGKTKEKSQVRKKRDTILLRQNKRRGWNKKVG